MFTWLEISCPCCGVVNWVDNGDTSDLTAPDQEGYQCWKCRKFFNLNDDEVDETFIPGDPLPHLPLNKIIELIGEENFYKIIKQ